MIQKKENNTVLCNSEAQIEFKRDNSEVGSNNICENDNKLLLLLKKHIEGLVDQLSYFLTYQCDLLSHIL